MNLLNRSAIVILSLFAAAVGHAADGSHTEGRDHAAIESIGKPGIVGKTTRTINVAMNDSMRFTPSRIDVKQNETVRLIITNSGKVKHELVLGTEKELKEHSEVMKKNPDMQGADPNMVMLDPGTTGEIVWRFTTPGKVDFACLEPGHYDAGMRGAFNVAVASDISGSK